MAKRPLHFDFLLSLNFLLIHKLFKRFWFLHLFHIRALIVNNTWLAHMMIGTNRERRFLSGSRNWICYYLVMSKKSLNWSSIKHFLSLFLLHLLHLCICVYLNFGFYSRWYILFFVNLLNGWIFHWICLYFYVFVHLELLIHWFWHLLICTQFFLINVLKRNYQMFWYFIP